MHLWKSEPNIMSWNCLPFNHLIPNTHNYALPRFCKQKICFLSNKNECLPIHMSMMYYIRLSNIDRNESVSCFTFWPQLSFYKDRHAFTVSWQKCCRFSILMLHLKWNLNWKCTKCNKVRKKTSIISIQQNSIWVIQEINHIFSLSSVNYQNKQEVTFSSL